MQEQFDIVATQCIPDIEGREIISLTVKDKSDDTEYKDLRYESRWKYVQDHNMSLSTNPLCRHVRSRNLELDQLWVSLYIKHWFWRAKYLY